MGYIRNREAEKRFNTVNVTVVNASAVTTQQTAPKSLVVRTS